MVLGKYRILKNYITACNYTFVLDQIEQTLQQKKHILIAPIASQTLVKAFYDNSLQKQLELFHLLVPDSQWVRKALNFLHGIHLKKRVYGPKLMLKVCKFAEDKKFKIYLYGSHINTLQKLMTQLKKLHPNLNIVGHLPSNFRDVNSVDVEELMTEIYKNKPQILFIGLGSPLQEKFAVKIAQTENKKVPLAIIPVGAAFDFISGIKKQAPNMIGDLGFEWLFRLFQEPKRLWKRYIVLGTLFLFLVIKQKVQNANT